MAQVSALFVSVTLFMIMFGLGLGLRADALRELQRRPGLVVRVLVGSCVLVPLVALLLLKLPLGAALSKPARLAIALMAVSPSAPLTLRKAGQSGGDRELAGLLQSCAAIAAIVSIPLMADLFRSTFRLAGWHIGPLEVALQVGRVQILPLLAGLLLRHWRPQWARELEGPLDRLANALFLVLIGVVLITSAPVLLPFLIGNGLALVVMAGMVLVALAIGSLMAGPSPRERLTVALVTSMRNPGLALLFAAIHAPDVPKVKIAVLSYLLVTVLLSIPFLRWQSSRPGPA